MMHTTDEDRPDLDAIEAFLEDCRAGRLPTYGLVDDAPAMLHACVGELRRLESRDTGTPALRAAAVALLTRLDHLTTEQFSLGGERAACEALRTALGYGDDEPTEEPATGPQPVDGAAWWVTKMQNDPASLVISLETTADEGDYLGEFTLRWIAQVGPLVSLPTPRLEVFSDSWTTLQASRIVDLLALWEPGITRDQAFAQLIDAGFCGR